MRKFYSCFARFKLWCVDWILLRSGSYTLRHMAKLGPWGVHNDNQPQVVRQCEL